MRCRPRKVAVCMIYYLDEAVVDSWAGAALCLLCYNTAPRVLQRCLDLAFMRGTCRVQVEGTEVVPVARKPVLFVSSFAFDKSSSS